MRNLMCLILVLGLSQTDAADWPMLNGSISRNNVSDSKNIPADWNVRTKKNIKWSAGLGSTSYGSPVVADGQIYVGTNNGNGYQIEYPSIVDRGCLICFRESDGEFLWQLSRGKHPAGRAHDWFMQGIHSSPCIEGDRMWFVSNLGEVICLDTKGFYDDEDDGEPTEAWVDVFSCAANLSDVLAANNSAVKPFDREIHDKSVRNIISSRLNLRNRRTTRIHSEKEFGKWTVKELHGDVYESIYQIELTRSELVIRTIVEPPKVVARYKVNFVEGLDRGEILPALLAQFQQYGLELSGTEKVQITERENDWIIQTVVRGKYVNIGLTREGERLVCRMEIGEQSADIVWSYNMMEQLGVKQLYRSTCSPAIWGETLFVCTGNAVNIGLMNIPAPEAPSFIALDKRTGKVLWTDKSPGKNILHGQWSSPTIGVFDGVPQVIFPGGDGWIYSFHAEDSKEGKPILLWKFDGNPKESTWIVVGSGTRNYPIAIPVVDEGKVYIAMGQDPEYGEGVGNLWCIDPARRGDISSELALDKEGNVIPHRRIQAVNGSLGERSVPNPNSGVIWNFREVDSNEDGTIDYEEEMHRSIASPVIKDGLLYIGDFAGIFHCIDANTGQPLWTHDCLSQLWGTALLVDGKVYVAAEDGDICVFEHSRTKNLLNEIYMEDSIKTTPIAVNDVLYIATLKSLYAIRPDSVPTTK